MLLDTNVLSELMRAAPEPKVLQWIDAIPDVDVWVSAIAVAEIGLGIALLPRGKRRDALTELAGRMFREDFSGRCLPFDFAAAGEYAAIVADRAGKGRPISVEDAQIAAIARAGRLALATRNVRDFSDIPGLRVVNPWEG